MSKLSALVIAVGLIVATVSVSTVGRAAEIKNVRAVYGLEPPGVPRADKKFLPRDVLFLHYQIVGLTVDEKTGNVNYDSVLEFFGPDGKSIDKKKNPKQQ